MFGPHTQTQNRNFSTIIVLKLFYNFRSCCRNHLRNHIGSPKFGESEFYARFTNVFISFHRGDFMLFWSKCSDSPSMRYMELICVNLFFIWNFNLSIVNILFFSHSLETENVLYDCVFIITSCKSPTIETIFIHISQSYQMILCLDVVVRHETCCEQKWLWIDEEKTT